MCQPRLWLRVIIPWKVTCKHFCFSSVAYSFICTSIGHVSALKGMLIAWGEHCRYSLNKRTRNKTQTQPLPLPDSPQTPTLVHVCSCTASHVSSSLACPGARRVPALEGCPTNDREHLGEGLKAGSAGLWVHWALPTSQSNCWKHSAEPCGPFLPQTLPL